MWWACVLGIRFFMLKKPFFICVLNTILHIVIAIIIPKVILDDDDEGAK